jgi:hypothetical protein
MFYKFVWAEGEVELGPGASSVHHWHLLERIQDRVNYPVESYVGGYFHEDNKHDGQFDKVEINWPGEGDVPSNDELRQIIQLELGRFRFDAEAMITKRVAAMKMGYDDLEEYEMETGKDHEKLYPYIWYDGNAIVGDPRMGHMGILDNFYELLQAPFAEYDYNTIPDTWYIGRVKRDGEVIPWVAGYPTPPHVQDAIRKKLFSKFAATSEDTEPEGLMVGFLRDPHQTLYPPLFDGAEPKPKALRILKDHVLNQLALNHYEDADYWIHFSIFGSGISFNWDELGDMDVQMWVDVDKFNEKHPNETFTADELVAEVRRIVQMVNFPSFHQLGLSTDDVKGDMLIQYYPKPGKGTVEENLASKPYACYDMDDEKWLQRPKPINPRFYGEHFLMVMTKAEEIAKQAEALLEQLNRNTTNWQFWSMLYHKYRNDKYLDQVELAERNADAEKLGVQELFNGVFGGRAEAYSEKGKGIEDERDIVQKLLEVWGIFQRLKHFARQPLPWEEQELPAPPSERGREGPTEGEEPDNEYDVDEPDHPTTLAARKHAIIKFAEWQDIMQNAQALRDEGAVTLTYNGGQHVEGQVASQSEPGQVYETSFERDDPSSSAITTWNCSCPWGEVSWGRTRQWKKYEGRPCKHTLAMYWESLSTPLDEDRPEAQGQGQLFDPAELNDGGFQPAPGPGGPNMGQPQAPAPQQPAAPPAPPPPPNPSVITAPGQGGTVSIPGTFSKLKESDFEFVSAFYNGQVVRAKMPMWGIDRDDNMQMVPQGTLGEVLWSDEAEAIVIFPLDSGALEPHLVRVKDGAGNFAPTRAKTPFVKRVR